MKDLLGLIKYLLIILPVIPLPVVLFYVTFGLYEIEPLKSLVENIPVNTVTTLILVVMNYYLIGLIIASYFYIPPLITIKAMNNNWGKYLNFFFNSFFLTTLFLILIYMASYVAARETTINILNFKIRPYYIITSLDFILPVYFIIYITTIFTNPVKEVTNAPKLIIWLNKIPKWAYSILIAFISLSNRENGYIYAIITLSCISILLNIRTKPQLN